MDLHGHHARRSGATDGGHVENGDILDGVQFGGELVLVPVFFQFVAEVEALDEAVPLRRDLVDDDALGPAKVRVNALFVLGSEGDFHKCTPWVEVESGTGRGQVRGGDG